MNALKLLPVYILALATFLAIDAFWLGVIAKGMYRRELGHLLAANVRLGTALLLYVIYVAGLLILVVLPHRGSSVATVAALGALFGFVAYAAYDLTNLATLERWPLSVTLADLAWGTFVTGVTAAASHGYTRWLLP